MANLTFVSLLPQVLPECEGCPQMIALNAIRTAAREFCERSTYWRAAHALITTVTGESGTGEYTLTIPAGAQIVSVVEPVMHDDEPVYFKSEQWLDMNYPNWRTLTGQHALYFTMKTPVIMRLVRYPTAAQVSGLRVNMILKPSPTATDIEDYVFNEWYEVLAAGAKAQLMVMKERDWSNPKEAARYGAMFEGGMEDALSKAVARFKSQAQDRRQKTYSRHF